MRYSNLFGKTVREAPADASTISHKLLYQAGFIRESTAGRYFFLPLGQLVQNKIINIIREEMNKAGAQEMLSPLLHPLDLWKETNRTNTAGFELMRIIDRRGAEFALGGTAEEMFVDIVRKFQISYKELPFNIYQFSNKFRDEMRARGGLLRLREFMMKDAYSFDVDEESFKKEYKNMGDTYMRIYEKVGLKTIVVESDGGYIGGDYCHEYVIESPIGESKFFMSSDGTYSAHEDVACFTVEEGNQSDVEESLKAIKAQRGKTMEDGVKLHNKPLWKQIKDVLFVDEQNRFILAIIRGDFDVNEVKLKKLIKAITLRSATDEEITNIIHSFPGFISPVGIKQLVNKDREIIIVADPSLRTVKNAYGGNNKQFEDLLNVNIDRDYIPDIEGDIALAKNGFLGPDGKSRLEEKRGIEVGNIFQLGYHYTSKMKNSVFTDEGGKTQPYYMGCYGLGIGRTLASLVEIYHDEKGIIWPQSVAPFQVHLIGLSIETEETKIKVDTIYTQLTEKGIEVLYDDRVETRAGEKFADADLIGIPHRIVVSKKTGDKLEYKARTEKVATLISIEEAIQIIGQK
ncbi:MAG: proline--tRNA ligase [Candidatus Roizmanbacteria bacterium]